MPDCRHHAAQIRNIARQHGNGFAEYRQKEADLVAPAAGQYGQQRRLWRNIVRGTKRIAALHQARPLEHGIADKARVDAMAREMRRLERQQRQHGVHIMRHALGPFGTRRPDLRRREIGGTDRWIEPLQPPRNAMREVRAVDQHDQVRARAPGKVGRGTNAA
jgi:hypothetical protein